MALTDKQMQVVNHDSGNILVSASAGSGKTHTMIERVVRLITEKRVKISRILCATFTEASAHEMKERLKKVISEKLWSSEGKHLKEQLRDIPTADICTLHAFCGKLIRAYFYRAGVSPDFKILDEGEASAIRTLAIDKTFKEFYARNEDWFKKTVDRYATHRNDKKLKEYILSLYAFNSSEADRNKLFSNTLSIYNEEGFNRLLKIHKRHLNEKLIKLLDKIVTAKEVFETANLVSGLNFTLEFLSAVQNVINAPDIYSVKPYKDFSLRVNFEKKLSDNVKEHKEIVSNAKKEFVKLVSNALAVVKDDYDTDFKNFLEDKIHTENLFRITQKFTEIYQQEKLEENSLDFNDLEHYALEVLKDEQIKNAVRAKYEYVFIDEYQDTNGVQEEIINKIENENLFMVGDVKQSIYGFRGCRADFFINKEKLMDVGSGTVVRLNKNFRSAKNVVDTVNEIFSFCMNKQNYGEDYQSKSELIYGEGFDADAKGRAELHFLIGGKREAKENEKPRVYDVFLERFNFDEQENDYEASLITNIINGELKKKIFDVKKGVYRNVCYSDIAVLTRSRNAELISGLIKRGVPVISDSAVNILDFNEIKVLINALKLIDCFLQDIPLASTLKSPICALTDEELSDIARCEVDGKLGGNFYLSFEKYLEVGETILREKLIKFKKYFDDLRFISDFIGAEGVLNKIINDFGIEAFYLASNNGEDKLFRIKKFVKESVVNGKKLTVREFLDKINTSAGAFGLMPFSSEDTVKVMTVHSSKGLEFPVVILSNLEKRFNKDDDYKEIMCDRSLGYAVKHFEDVARVKTETLLRACLRENLKAERIKEEMRLFYVATTRAMYSLHMVFSGDKDPRKDFFDGADRFLDFIPKSIDITIHQENELTLESKFIAPKQVLIGKPNEQLLDALKENFNFTYQFNEDTTLPLKYTVTGALKENIDSEQFVHVLIEDDTTDTESGTIAHKLLENFDFYSNKTIFEQADELVKRGVLSEQDLTKINLQRIANAIKDNVFHELKDYALYREKAFLVSVPGRLLNGADTDESVLLQGVIDLLAVSDNGAIIVDYKYSSLTNESLVKKYKKQLELYKYAVENVLGVKVQKTVLVNVFVGYSEIV